VHKPYEVKVFLTVTILDEIHIVSFELEHTSYIKIGKADLVCLGLGSTKIIKKKIQSQESML
jgi:hypothetical protein